MKVSSKVCSTRAVLIDGFNLIYKFPDLGSHMTAGRLGDGMKGLLERLRDYHRATGRKIRVVFDGKKAHGLDLRSERFGTIDVFYSIEQTADQVIMNFIKTDPQPRLTTVVTSDRQIISFAARYGAPVVQSDIFAGLMIEAAAPPEEPEPPEKDEDVALSNDELSFWEKLFRK